MGFEDLKKAARKVSSERHEVKCKLEGCGELARKCVGGRGPWCSSHARRKARTGDPRGASCSRCNCPNIPSFPDSRLCDFCHAVAATNDAWQSYRRRNGMANIGPHSKPIPKAKLAGANAEYRARAVAHNRAKFPQLKWGRKR